MPTGGEGTVMTEQYTQAHTENTHTHELCPANKGSAVGQVRFIT